MPHHRILQVWRNQRNRHLFLIRGEADNPSAPYSAARSSKRGFKNSNLYLFPDLEYMIIKFKYFFN